VSTNNLFHLAYILTPHGRTSGRKQAALELHMPGEDEDRSPRLIPSPCSDGEIWNNDLDEFCLQITNSDNHIGDHDDSEPRDDEADVSVIDEHGEEPREFRPSSDGEDGRREEDPIDHVATVTIRREPSRHYTQFIKRAKLGLERIAHQFNLDPKQKDELNDAFKQFIAENVKDESAQQRMGSSLYGSHQMECVLGQICFSK
jgi:hypothetical protein